VYPFICPSTEETMPKPKPTPVDDHELQLLRVFRYIDTKLPKEGHDGTIRTLRSDTPVDGEKTAQELFSLIMELSQRRALSCTVLPLKLVPPPIPPGQFAPPSNPRCTSVSIQTSFQIRMNTDNTELWRKKALDTFSDKQS